MTGLNTSDSPQLQRRTTGKGQAHDPLEDHLYLDVGPGPADSDEETDSKDHHDILIMVSESPSTADTDDMYAKAFQAAVERIEKDKDKEIDTVVYMTRRMEKEQRHAHGSEQSGGGRLRGLMGKMVQKPKAAAQDSLAESSNTSSKE